MKKIFIMALLCAMFYSAHSQTNTLPSSGSVGIGTTFPSAPLQIQTPGGTGAIQLGPWVSNPSAGTIYLNGDFGNANNYNFLSAPSAALYLNRPTGYSMLFREGNTTDEMVIAPGGNVGIGTTNPTQALTVNGTVDASHLSSHGNLGIGSDVDARIYMLNTTSGKNWNLISETDGSFETGIYGSSPFQTITSSGNVGIGTTTPDAKLAVNGTIHSKAVIIDLVNWPDYVFKPAYHLTPLSEVKTYIALNHHLPDMPSDKEVEAKGLDVAEMNKLLTKKVEELTLYLIEKDKEMKEVIADKKGQQEVNKLQQQQIDELKKQMAQLIKQ
jgi:hypothetical protein